MDFRLITLFLIASVILTRVVYAQPSDAPDEPAATQPAATQPATSPATQPASVSPDAQAVLERVRAAYAKLQGLEVAGTYALELDVAGQRQNKESQFTGSFKAPDRFRHEMTDDALVVGGPGAGPARGGDANPKAYLYVPGTGKYAEADAPAGRSALMASHEPFRSEERRVGKEGRSRWSAEHEKKKTGG